MFVLNLESAWLLLRLRTRDQCQIQWVLIASDSFSSVFTLMRIVFTATREAELISMLINDRSDLLSYNTSADSACEAFNLNNNGTWASASDEHLAGFG